MAKRTLRSIAGMLCLFTILGALIGLSQNLTVPKYESRAVIQIVPNFTLAQNASEQQVAELIQLCEKPHDKLLVDRKFVENCLVRNNLFVIDSFVGSVVSETVDEVVENLNVQRLTEDGKVLAIKLRLNKGQDSATVLNNLIKHYYDDLRAAHPTVNKLYWMENLQVARTGKLNWAPISNVATGACLGMLAAALIWLLLRLLNVSLFKLQWSTLLLFLLVPITLAIAGVGVVTWFEGMPYESHAQIKIVDAAVEEARSRNDQFAKLINLATEKHEVQMAQYNFIENSCHADSLFGLPVFNNLANEEIVMQVQQNLRIVGKDDEKSTFDVSFKSDRPKETQTILDSLINNYVKRLKLKNPKSEASVENDEIPNSESELLPLYRSEIVQSASAAKRVPFALDFHSPRPRLAGVLGAVIGLILCEVWFLHRNAWSNARQARQTEH